MTAFTCWSFKRCFKWKKILSFLWLDFLKYDHWDTYWYSWVNTFKNWLHCPWFLLFSKILISNVRLRRGWASFWLTAMPHQTHKLLWPTALIQFYSPSTLARKWCKPIRPMLFISPLRAINSLPNFERNQPPFSLCSLSPLFPCIQ